MNYITNISFRDFHAFLQAEMPFLFLLTGHISSYSQILQLIQKHICRHIRKQSLLLQNQQGVGVPHDFEVFRRKAIKSMLAPSLTDKISVVHSHMW